MPKHVTETANVFSSKNYATLAALVTAADAAGGCAVQIVPGSYSTAPLRFTKSNITIHADGATITLANGANAPVLSFGPDAMNINVLGGRWDGNKANNASSHGIQFEEYVGAFIKDNGAGKTQLYARFGTGAVVAVPGVVEP